jgi:hypothetical protein
MLEKADVIDAVSFDLLKKGYVIVRKSPTGEHDTDLVARHPETKARILISASGAARSKAGRGKLEESYLEARVFRCVTKSIYSAMKVHGADRFDPGDRIALAFPDTPTCHKYLSAEKPILDSLGITVFLVSEDKKVETL